MKKRDFIITSLLITLFLVVSVIAIEEIFFLEVDVHQSGKIDLVDYYVSEGSVSIDIGSEPKNYKVEFLSSDNKIIYSAYFEPSFDIHLDILPGEEPDKGIIPQESVRQIIKVPYSSKISKVKFYYKNSVVLSQSIRLCNENGLCEDSQKENVISCPSDCSTGTTDGFCDGVLDGRCDKDCVNQGRSEKDIDCTCGNAICDVRENEKICSLDCRVSFWQWLVNLIKSIWR